MSTCISQRGEFGSHEPDADYVCTFCGVLDEDALIEELRQARESVSSLTAENERLRKERDDLEAGKGELYDDLVRADQAIRNYRSRAEAAERWQALAQPVLESAKAVAEVAEELAAAAGAAMGDRPGDDPEGDAEKLARLSALVAAVDTYETAREGA